MIGELVGKITAAYERGRYYEAAWYARELGDALEEEGEKKKARILAMSDEEWETMIAGRK